MTRLAPKPMAIAERFTSHKCGQKENEAVLDYVAELRKLAHTCDFGTHMGKALCVRLAGGVCQRPRDSIC